MHLSFTDNFFCYTYMMYHQTQKFLTAKMLLLDRNQLKWYNHCECTDYIYCLFHHFLS